MRPWGEFVGNGMRIEPVSRGGEMWNVKFLKMAPDKRIKQLSVIAKRFDEKDADYWSIQAVVKAAAREHGCPEDAVRLDRWDYPEEIEW